MLKQLKCNTVQFHLTGEYPLPSLIDAFGGGEHHNQPGNSMWCYNTHSRKKMKWKLYVYGVLMTIIHFANHEVYVILKSIYSCTKRIITWINTANVGKCQSQTKSKEIHGHKVQERRTHVLWFFFFSWNYKIKKK